MSVETVKVFVSSTWKDLTKEREVLEEALQGLRATKFVGMEYFGSQHEDTATASLQELKRCQLYVGIFGARHGSGITELEYRCARESNLPCLIYLKDDSVIDDQDRDDDEERRRRLKSLKLELEASHTTTRFRTPHELAVRVAVDLHKRLFDKYLVQGMGSLPGDVGTRVQNFLHEYLGTAEQPVPFGGRNREFALLDDWLTQSSAPYLLISGPAGRGKSALLVRWLERVAARSDVAAIFVPISVRFRTNLASVVFAAITARVALLHGDSLPGTADTPAEVWRSLMSSYLARELSFGRTLLVVLDGIDEAADFGVGPDLFPIVPGARVRVVLSARSLAGDSDAKAWLERLGWSSSSRARGIDLKPLAPAGVADVLARASPFGSRYSTDPEFVAELFRLTEGDPLLIRLYVTDLLRDARGDVPSLAALRSRAPGLDGYFERWWQEQRQLWQHRTPLLEPAVQTVLNLLSCALGPLRVDDLLRLLPESAQITIWTLEEALLPLNRFVIGRGDAQGYVFGHPRLAAHFYERLHSAGQAYFYEQLFVTWGERTVASLNAERLGPADVSVYLIRYFRAHLERAGGRPESFFALLSPGWLQAWNRVDNGSYAGFLGDVERVGNVAEVLNGSSLARGEVAPHLGVEVLCALCRSSVASLAGVLPLGLVLELHRQAAWSVPQVLAYATRIPDLGLRLRTLLELWSQVEEAQRPLVLAAAVAVSRSLALVDAQATEALIAGLVGELSGSGRSSTVCDRFEALAMLMCLFGTTERENLTRVAVTVAERQLAGNDWERVCAVFSELGLAPTEWAQASKRGVLGSKKPRGDGTDGAEPPHSTAAHRVDGATIVARRRAVWERPTRRQSLTKIAQARRVAFERLAAACPAQLGNKLYIAVQRSSGRLALDEPADDEPRGLLSELAIEALWLPEPERIRILHQIAERLSELNEPKAWPEIEALVESISGMPRAHIWFELAQSVPESQREKAMLQALLHCQGRPYSEFQDIFEGVLEYPHPSEALLKRALECVVGSRLLIEPFESLAPKLTPELRARAIALILGLGNQESQGPALSIAVHVDPAPIPFRDVLEAIRGFKSEEQRVRALALLTPMLTPKLRGAALEIAVSIVDEATRAQALAVLAPHLAEPDWSMLIDAVGQFSEDWWRSAVLREQAGLLPQALLADALLVARNIADGACRGSAIATLAPRLEPSEARRAMLEALSCCSYFATGMLEAFLSLSDPGPELLARAAEIAGPPELGSLAHRLTVPMLIKAAAASSRLGDRFEVDFAVATLAARVGDRLVAESAFESAFRLHRSSRSQIEQVLREILPSLSAAAQAAFLTDTVKSLAAWIWNNEEASVDGFRALSARLAEASYEAVLEALDFALTLKDESVRLEMLVALVPVLSRPERLRAFAAVAELHDEALRVDALTAFGNYLPADRAANLVERASSIRDEHCRGRCLVGIASVLDPAQLARAIGIARALRSSAVRALTLAGLAVQAPEEDRLDLLRCVAAALHTPSSAALPLPQLVWILEALTEDLREKVAASLFSLPPANRARLAAALALVLPEHWAARIIAALEGTRGRERRDALGCIAALAPGALSELACSAVRALEGPLDRAMALKTLASHANEPRRQALLMEALHIASGLSADELAREVSADLIAAVWPHNSVSTLRGLMDQAGVRVSELLERVPVPSTADASLKVLELLRAEPAERERVAALRVLAPLLWQSTAVELLALCSEFRADCYRAEAFHLAAERVPDAALAQLVVEAGNVLRDDLRAELACAIAARPGRQDFETYWGEGLAAIARIGNTEQRAELLARVIPTLEGPLAEQALRVADELENDLVRAEVLCAFAHHGPESLLPALRARAVSFSDALARAVYIAELAVRSQHERDALLEASLAALDEEPTRQERAEAAYQVALRLPQSRAMTRALASAAAVRHEGFLAQTLCGLAPIMHHADLRAALNLCLGLHNETERARALVGVTSHLPEPWQTEAVTAIGRLRDEPLRAAALSECAQHLGGLALDRALRVSLQFRSETYRAELLYLLAPFLDAQQLDLAFDASLSLRDNFVRLEVVCRLLPYLSGVDLARALSVFGRLEQDPYRCTFLAHLAPVLPKALVSDALAAARGITDLGYRALALHELVVILDETEQTRILQELATDLSHLEDTIQSTALVSEIAESLDSALGADALDRAPHEPETLRLNLERTARQRRPTTPTRSAWAQLLSEPPPQSDPTGWHSGPVDLTIALTAIKSLDREGDRLQRILGLIPRLPSALLPLALDIAAAFIDEQQRSLALAELAPHWPTTCFGRLCRELERLKSGESRELILNALVPGLVKLRPGELYTCWSEIRRMIVAWPRSEFLRVLRVFGPVLFQLGGPAGVRATRDAIDTVAKWWP